MEYHSFTTYEQLISERKIVQSQVIDFINAQKSKGLTADSIGNYLTAVKHFYVYNDVTDINWLKVKKFLGERTKTVNDRAYTKEEIAQILSKCDERKRVIVLLLASTGMRIGAIPGLSIGSLHRIETANLYRITVYERTKDQYFAFCTPECAIAIDDYLEYRKRYGKVLKPAAPLIREQFDKKDSFAVQHPRRNSNFTIEKLLRESDRSETKAKQDQPRASW